MERGERKGNWRIERKHKEEKIKGWKVAFWNVARMGNKDKGFREIIEEWDVMILMET